MASNEINWIEFDMVSTRNRDVNTYGWIGIEPRYAWPTLYRELNPNYPYPHPWPCPSYTLKKTLNPPPPNPPLSIIMLFSEPALSDLTATIAHRLAAHFKFCHLDLRAHILSLAINPQKAFQEGWLVNLFHENFARFVSEDRICEIPGRFLVEIIKKKIDALVAEGHRRFVVTGFPDTLNALPRFLGHGCEDGVSDLKAVIWLLEDGSVLSRERKAAIEFFSRNDRAICVASSDGSDVDEVYGDLMARFYERALKGGAMSVQKVQEIIELEEDEQECGKERDVDRTERMDSVVEERVRREICRSA